MLSRLLAAMALGVALVGPAIDHAGPASAVPCYAASCVPNVAQNVIPGTPCAPSGFFSYGLDSGGATYVCTVAGLWTQTGPLLGVYNVPMPCDQVGASAQGSNGTAVQCQALNQVTKKWQHRTDTPGPPRCFSATQGCPFWEMP